MRCAVRGPWAYGAACALVAAALAWDRLTRAAPTVAVVAGALVLLVPTVAGGWRARAEAGAVGRPAPAAALVALGLLGLPYRAFVADGLGGGAAFGLVVLGLFLGACGREAWGAAAFGPAVLGEPGLAVLAFGFAARRRFRATAAFAATASAALATSWLAGDLVPRLSTWVAGAVGGRATGAAGAGMPTVASEASLWSWGARLWAGDPTLGPLSAALALAVPARPLDPDRSPRLAGPGGRAVVAVPGVGGRRVPARSP